MSKQSLSGAHIVVTRPEVDCVLLLKRIKELGGHPTCIPMVRIVPESPQRLAPVRQNLSQFGWIAVTSRNSARCLLQDAVVPKKPPQVAALGPATAAAVVSCGWPVDLVAEGKGSIALAQAMLQQADIRSAPVLFPGSSKALPHLPDTLREQGVQVERVVVYRTESADAQQGQRLVQQLADPESICLFASPSAAKNAHQALQEQWQRFCLTTTVAIGPTTAKAMDEVGFKRVIVAERPDDAHLVVALEQAFAEVCERSGA